MPGGGLLGRRKASFSTSTTTHTTSIGTAASSTSSTDRTYDSSSYYLGTGGTSNSGSLNGNGSGPYYRRSGGVKLTLEDDEDDEDGGGNGNSNGGNGGIDGLKLKPPSSNTSGSRLAHSSSTSNLAGAFPVVGAGSRTKILYQLGEPANLTGPIPLPPSSISSSSSLSPSSVLPSFPALQPRRSSSSLQGGGTHSPSYVNASSSSSLSSPGLTGNHNQRPRHFRKSSSNTHKLSLTGIRDVITSSPVTTPTHLTGVIRNEDSSYFDFSSLRAPPPSSSSPSSSTANGGGHHQRSASRNSGGLANTNPSIPSASPSASNSLSLPVPLPPQTPASSGRRSRRPSWTNNFSSTVTPADVPQYAIVPESDPPADSFLEQTSRPRSTTKSSSTTSLVKLLSPSARQKSAPPNAQTFKAGLPSVGQSPRSVYATSIHGQPGRGSSTSLNQDANSGQKLSSQQQQQLDTSSEPFPSGLVSARSASYPDIDGPSQFTSTSSLVWPVSESRRSLQPDLSADDGQLEEIVPWLYQSADGSKSPTAPLSPGSPFQQRQLGTTQQGSTSHRPSVSNILRPSKSAANVRQTERSGSGQSFELPTERERKQSNRFMGMLRKKSSAFVDAVSNSSSGRERGDDQGWPPSGSGSSSSKTNIRMKMSPRDEELHSGRSRKSKKDKRGKDSALPLPRQAVVGISLDTNLDEMEGIVDLNKNTFSSNYSMSNPYEHINAVTAGNTSANANTAAAAARPGTPPSPSQIPTLRRPSIGATASKFEFVTTEAQDLSPLGKRLGLSRKESMDIQSGLQKWPPGVSSPGMGAANSSNGAARKNSLASLVADRRGSDGTVNGIPLAPDAGWTAPDSWAVKPSDLLYKEEDSDDDDVRIKSDTTALGSLPPTPLLNGDPTDMSGTNFVAGVTNGFAANGWRPGTAGGGQTPQLTFSRPANAMAAIRIHKVDNSHTILNLPYNTTVSEVLNIVAKKPGFIASNSKFPVKAYKLYMRSNGLERMMASGEKPLQWQDRKFRAAGYDPDSDKLEDLGREDNSYLCKFIFKPETVLVAGRLDEYSLESFEFIDLAARGIENLPVFLHKHAHEVISLNISRNFHLHLPTDFVQACSSLRDLKMVEMGMKRIPQSVKEVPGLTRLDVSINRIVELEHCALYENRELTTFNAFNNRLTSLPDYFVHFKTLKYLNISNNRFEMFPVVICEVASLVDLDISFNSLTSLPPEIGKLKHLETLILLCNKVTSLPSTIRLLSRLRELDCRRNRIEDFSPVTAMPNLQSVRAQHNMTKALDLHSGNLAILNLSYNPITRFTVDPAQRACALTHLDLSNTRLEAIPEEMFSTCVSLQVLALNDNKIRSISENVGNLEKLGRLSVNNNALQSLPVSIGKLQRLHTLELSNNKLATLPDIIWQCSELATLNVSSNVLVDFPEPPVPPADSPDDNDRQLSASRVPALTLSLKRLYIAYNRLRDDVFRPLALLSGLTVLNLSFNEIYEIPAGMLQKCYHLTHLYLSGNMLTSLPADDLERLINLRVLHLNGNKLQTLPAELGSIQTLQVLDVGTNALKYNIANWPYDWNWNWNLQLRYLNLSGNKRLEIKPSAQSAQEISPNGAPVKRRNLSDFSALSHLRVLGLMDVTLMIPSVPDETDSRRVRTSLSSINEMGYGVADTLGSSEHLSMIDLVVPRFRGKDDECVVGLFDTGFQDKPGGSKIIKFIVDQFVQRLTLELSRLRDEDASQGLRRSFLSLNRNWGNSVTLDFDRARKGSDVYGQSDRFTHTNASNQINVRACASAVVVYLYKKTLYVANVGDCMALIAGRTMLARDLTTRHEPFTTDEIARIRSAEGWVSPRGLVNDEEGCARAFGAFHVFPAVNSDPAVHVLDLVDSDEFVIIANHGLWSVLSSQMAVDVAWENKSDPMLAAQKLRDLAVAYGADNSIMVMVVNVGDLFKGKQPLINRGLSKASTDPELIYDRPRRPQGSVPGLRIAEDTAAPQGTVALVFTDIRNSTALWETNPGMQNAMRIHHELLRRLIRAFDGYEVKTEGDAFMVSFSSVTTAVLWAFTVQLELLRADWPAELLMSDEGKELYGPNGELVYRGLSVRMGMHWGAPICEQDPVNHRMDYLGPMVNRASRVSGVAEGGQITASADAVEVLQAMLSAFSDEEDRDNPLVDPSQLDAATKRDIAAIRQLGCGIKEIGEHKLKGLETPEFLSIIFPNALAGRLSGGQSKEALMSAAQLLQAKSGNPSGQPILQSILDHQELRALAALCLRLEALSAGNEHRFYESSSSTSPHVGHHSPALGYGHSSAAPKRRTTLSPHLLASIVVRSEATDEELLVLFESLLVRIENALASMQLRHLGPFTDVLAALGDAVKIEPGFILQALTMLSQML